MDAEKAATYSTRRWFVVAGALVVQVCLGAVYAWSVFVNPLKDEHGFSTTQTQIVFAVALATFAVTMIFAGRWQDRAGPRRVAIAGGLALGAGYVLAGLTGGSFAAIVLSIGLIGGAGIGLGYVCPIAAGMKWFPDKKGFIAGLTVAGFGGGAWLFGQLGTYFVETAGVLTAFVYLGVIFALAVVAGAMLLTNPPKGWKPVGAPATAAAAHTGRDYAWRDMIRTHEFWMLWVMFMIGATAGLMVIGNLKPFGEESGLSAAVAGAAVGVLAVFNAAGRIVWGTLSDKLGRATVFALMFSVQGVIMLFLISMGSFVGLFLFAAAVIGFDFGGNFALFPSATADYFGSENLGLNYGLLFTSYGVAGIVGPILGGSVLDATGSYMYAFVPAGIACLAAAVLALALGSERGERVRPWTRAKHMILHDN